jgi:sugar transferase (PEP-CTERM system associated)
MIRVFRVFVPTSVIALLISEIVLLFACYILFSYWILDVDAPIFLMYENGLVRIAGNVAVIILGLYFNDLYARFRAPSQTRLLQEICLVIGVAFIFQALLGYADRNWILPRWIMLEGSAAALVLLSAWRVFYGHTVLNALGSERLLFLGLSPIVLQIASHLKERPETGLVPIGYLAENPDIPEDSGGLPCLGTLKDLKEVAATLRPNRIVVGLKERRQTLPIYELLDLRFSGILTEEVANTYELTFGRVCATTIRPSHLIFSSELGPRRRSVQIQSVYSWLIAFIAAVLTLPVMVMVALAVKLTSAGPVIYRQRRVGQNGEVYLVYKFRSMYQNAEARTGAVWATRDDPRVTPLGKILRKTRLDELPQLFNVLQGRMSIVGPRPERPEFVKTLSETIPYYRQRHCVKPGITGWAQINYKYGETLEDTIMKLEYDLYYIKNLSPALDMYVMFHTLKTMLLSRGGQ